MARTQLKTMQSDGINLNTGLYVDRPAIIDWIIQTAEEKQHVVLSSPPATGKSSLLDLLEKELESRNEQVFFCTPEVNSEQMRKYFHSFGLVTGNITALRKVERRWILIDDAQRGYTADFEDMWAFIVKDLKYNPNIKVVIAATHDMTTLGSPAAIGQLPHVFANFSDSEVSELLEKFCINFNVDINDEHWASYWSAVRDLSLIKTSGGAEYHIGVILNCLMDLERTRKVPNETFDGRVSQENLLKSDFIRGFDRCFAVNTEMIQDAATRDKLTDILLGLSPGVMPEKLKPLVRAGVLTRQGTFTCQAATWFYNQIYFPGRADSLPGSLQELVEQAVESLSSARLKACVQDNLFPLETAFQHLLNEAINRLLPTDASLKPEYRTKATGFTGDIKRGFIDFYVNDTVQWAIELLRLGKGLTEHKNRFHPVTGKYRSLPTKNHLIVDIRGPKGAGDVVPPEHNLCVLYFSADWSSCLIQMEMKPEKVLQLQL